jgi:hypothetical protein
MKTKTLTIEAMDEAGKGLARIATLSAVDHDGDTYLPGAFSWKEGGQQWCSILPAHDGRATPLGKARVYEDADAALAELFFNLEIPAAKSWHSAIMFDLANGGPVQEYSYGFDTIDADFQMRGADRVRLLKRLDVHEVSPVLKGAGIGTRTLAMKGASLKEEHFASLIGGLGELADALPADASAISATGLKQLEEIERAIGGVLSPLREAAAKERAAIDSALAGFLLHQSRPHLPG